ncbi:MAG: DUF362 domain-containing protein [bacterium]|nr:DUF362 domain-containing protein [bacterium]
MNNSIVSLIKVKETVQNAVKEAMEKAQWYRFITRGANVALKPNLGFDLFLPGAVTSPWVVEGVIQTIQGYVNEIYLVESGQILVNVEKALRQTKMDKLCQEYKVKWLNMSKDSFRRIKLENGLVFKEIEVPEILFQTELITIPVMKTHDKTTVTLAIKNQWGCLRELRHNYHLVVNEALVDINSIVKAKFAVLDATICLEGNAPKSGKPKVVDLILASGDIVALDTVAAKIMGFEPTKIKSITNCANTGLGNCNLDKIEIVGEDISRLNFNFISAKHNYVSFWELLFRKSTFRNFIFKTPIFNICCFGAIVWYFVWYYLGKGKKYRNEILLHPKYGMQWK